MTIYGDDPGDSQAYVNNRVWKDNVDVTDSRITDLTYMKPGKLLATRCILCEHDHLPLKAGELICMECRGIFKQLKSKYIHE